MIATLPFDSDSPYYTFRVRLDGAQYALTARWNPVSERWYMDIEGVSNGVRLYGRPLVVGVDILAPFAILELGSIYVLDGSRRGTDPTRDSLGTIHSVVYASRGELS